MFLGLKIEGIEITIRELNGMDIAVEGVMGEWP